jgi:hypothetical protein
VQRLKQVLDQLDWSFHRRGHSPSRHSKPYRRTRLPCRRGLLTPRATIACLNRSANGELAAP